MRWPPVSDAQYIAKFKAKCTITPRGCWQWRDLGRHPRANGPNYPGASYRGKNWRLNRLMITLTQRPLRPKEQALHKCDNHLCINPDHLFIGTNQDNAVDASRKGRQAWQWKTHCKHGHPLTPDNVYYAKRTDRTPGSRNCLTCNRIRMRSPEYRRKANIRQQRRRAAQRAQVNGTASI